MRLGALEAGGTKMVCAITDDEGNIEEKISIKTATPEETMPPILDFFDKGQVEAIGIGAFGPVSLAKDSPDYGHILDTPKLAWRNFDLVGTFKSRIPVPVEIDTDVNASCLGEVTYGTAKDLSCVLYLTVGTGIGAGVYVNGQPLHGMLHPEAGHIRMIRHPKETFEGICPYHKNCFEGLASGPAIQARYQKPATELYDCKEVWELEAYYIGQALTCYLLILSPQRIILGGGVMHQKALFPMIRENVLENLGGYINTTLIKNIEEYIVPASLGENQGILGATALARKALEINHP